MLLYDHGLATTKVQQMLKVTELVREDIRKSGVQEGLAFVFSPHTTAGFTINENADPDVVRDILMKMEETIPTDHPRYRHYEGNSHSHIKTTLFGPSQMLIIDQGKPVLGVWQDLYFCEFDGPRQRHFYVKIMEG